MAPWALLAINVVHKAMVEAMVFMVYSSFYFSLQGVAHRSHDKSNIRARYAFNVDMYIGVLADAVIGAA